MKKAPSRILYILIVIVLVTGSTLFFNTKPSGKVSASASTTLYFAPSSSLLTPIHKNGGDPLNLNIMLDPGHNFISIIKMKISYDVATFKGDPKNLIQLDPQVFPVIIDGPLINTDSGNITVTLSVGPTPSRSIKGIVKIGTLNLTTLPDNSVSSTLIRFGPETSAYSVAPQDQAFEDVLVNANPAYLTVGLGNSLTPTGQGTPIFRPPTFTPIPTRTPTPPVRVTPTPTPGANDTVIFMNVGLHGIGSSGDSVNARGDLSNKHPLHFAPPFKVNLYSSSGSLVKQATGLLVYDKTSGTFRGGINMGSSVPAGSYVVKVVSQNRLIKRVPGILQMQTASKVTAPAFAMVSGDINGDNVLNILDYNLLMNCYTDIGPASENCKKTSSINPDINEDDFINFGDYNLFVREVSVQHGD
jgi:hypothetical protein